MPGTGDTHLLGTILGRMPGQRVQVSLGELCSEKLRRELERFSRVDAAFYPCLRDAMTLPIGEQADAVPARENFIEVVFQMIHR